MHSSKSHIYFFVHIIHTWTKLEMGSYEKSQIIVYFKVAPGTSSEYFSRVKFESYNVVGRETHIHLSGKNIHF